MSRPVYRLDAETVQRLRKFIRIAKAEYTSCQTQYEQGLKAYTLDTISSIELDTMYLYYVQQQTVDQIAEYKHKCRSTVSRNLNRGTTKAVRIVKLAMAISPIDFDKI